MLSLSPFSKVCHRTALGGNRCGYGFVNLQAIANVCGRNVLSLPHRVKVERTLSAKVRDRMRELGDTVGHDVRQVSAGVPLLLGDPRSKRIEEDSLRHE